MMQSVPSAVVPIPGGNGLRGLSDHPSPTSTSTPPGISPSSSHHNPILNSSGGRPRRPRSRRDKDKRFTCDFEGCDKTYTRAEHLTRHQLNHQGAYKFVCRVDPHCGKKFVRGDLLARHEERHQNKKNKQALSDHEGHSPPRQIAPSPKSAPSPSNELASQMNRSITIPMSSPDSDAEYEDRSTPDEMVIDSTGYPFHSPPPGRPPFPPNLNTNGQSYAAQPLSASNSNYHGGFVPVNPNFSHQGAPTMEPAQRPFNMASEPINIPHAPFSPQNQVSPPAADTNVFASVYTGLELMADLGTMGQENWPDIWLPNNANIPTNFSWEAGTFSEHYGELSQAFPTGSSDTSPYEGRRPSVYYPSQHIPVGALLSDAPSFNSSPIISQETRDIILTEHLKWPLNSDTVVNFQQYLTPEALSEYVNVYWREFHPQYPILHRPTTTINRYAHLPLFIAMIEIGMSLGGDANAHALALAIHETLRWQIYSSESFRHPAKLWEMQTLLLREIYDKMLARRHQHEMSHTFHGALLTLMRRGTTLDGFLYREDQQPETSMSIESSHPRSEQIKRWHDFVEKECTKRVAFLAFIIDSQHSMMFGHSLVLHAQELNLKPPCKEDVWAAGSPMDWQRALQRQKVAEQNMEQPGFIEILKIFMNEPHTAKEKMSLDPFGSFIVLHGLISVKWHLQQKALGMGVTTNAQSGTASPSIRAVRERDHWKLSVEQALSAWRACMHGINTGNPTHVKFNRSSLPLYRLANITLWTNILDLQILAGMNKIMGKPVKHQAGLNVLLRLATAWANSEGSLKSVYHALKLLLETYFSSSEYLPSRTQDGSYNHFQRMDYALDGILHGKWCLYLATLTLWAWGAVASANSSREGSVMAMGGISAYNSIVKLEEHDTYDFSSYPIEDDATAWHHAKAYLKAMTEAGQERHGYINCPARTETRGLVVVMHNLLKDERWELLQEGSKLCFKILTGQHLAINMGSEDMQNLFDARRLSMMEGGASY